MSQKWTGAPIKSNPACTRLCLTQFIKQQPPQKDDQKNKTSNMTRNSSGSWKPDTCGVAKVSKPPTTLAAASANFSTSPKTPSFPVPNRAKQKQPREMENRARLLLRVQKNKPTTKRSGRKPLLKKLASFLKCDTFMYAPLVSPLPPDFPSPPDNFASSAKGLPFTHLF